MPIDVKTPPPGGPDAPAVAEGAGFVMARLAKTLHDEQRLNRLAMLDDWYQGDPNLPGVPAAARTAVREFHEHSCTNFALLIAEAVRERQRVRGIRTAADDDATGDGAAWALWTRMRMPLVSADVHRLKARFGQAYALVSPPSPDEPGVPVVTAEDPRWCVAEIDPARPWRPRCGLKMLHDPAREQTRAYLYRPGRVDVAYVKTRTKDGARFSPTTWNWDTDKTMAFADPTVMPLVPFEALDGKGEYEQHLKLLRRINFMILQQLTIAVLQAFKQRAVKGVPLKDDKGNTIDYNDIFTADPGALWLLPATAEMWESGQVDLTGLLTGVRDYIRQLAAVSRTPMHMLDPSGENQSAEGAALSREGLVFKVEDRNSRDQLGWSQVVSTAYRWLETPVEDVSIIWAPPQRASLSERASALSQASAAGVPFRSRMITFGEFDPADVDRMEVEREDDMVLSARVATMKAEMAPQPAQATPQPDAQQEPVQDAPTGDQQQA